MKENAQFTLNIRRRWKESGKDLFDEIAMIGS
jgi:hypothetical protein